MKKTFRPYLVVLSMTFVLTGCINPTPVTPPEPSEDATLLSIAVSGQTTEYKVGETFTFDGICTASYSDGGAKVVTPTNVTNISTSTVGNKTVVVSYTEKTVTAETRYTVSVVKDGGGDEGDYYASAQGLTGTQLLSALRAINKNRRTKTVGYGSMGTSASGMFKYTDYDPTSVQYDSKGQPYGTRIVSFYSGNTMTSFNREHVWPNTHGGNLVEADIHMPRPTIPSENGSRGHSFFIEGMKDNEDGWDPAMESFGVESYRGDSARIIFYCMVASDQLTLTDDGSRSHYTKNKEMGVISDMLSWNLRYPVDPREERRNEGAQYLQGNRNPFIDHPEYACKIWGNTNATTKRICGM